MNGKYVIKTRNLIQKELAKIIHDEVQPLTNLPLENTLETDIQDGYFFASGSIGHPGFGYFGYASNGIVVGFIGIPVSVIISQIKSFLYPIKSDGNQMVLDGEATPFYAESLRTAALASNKLLFINAVCSGVVPEDKFNTLAKNINTVIEGMLNGFI